MSDGYENYNEERDYMATYRDFILAKVEALVIFHIFVKEFGAQTDTISYIMNNGKNLNIFSHRESRSDSLNSFLNKLSSPGDNLIIHMDYFFIPDVAIDKLKFDLGAGWRTLQTTPNMGNAITHREQGLEKLKGLQRLLFVENTFMQNSIAIRGNDMDIKKFKGDELRNLRKFYWENLSLYEKYFI